MYLKCFIFILLWISHQNIQGKLKNKSKYANKKKNSSVHNEIGSKNSKILVDDTQNTKNCSKLDSALKESNNRKYEKENNETICSPNHNGTAVDKNKNEIENVEKNSSAPNEEYEKFQSPNKKYFDKDGERTIDIDKPVDTYGFDEEYDEDYS